MTILSWLNAKIYDKGIQKAEIRCLRDWRGALLNDLSGKVLEIGCGTGLNLAHYPQRVTHLTLLEPDVNMRKKLAQKNSLPPHVTIELIDSTAELIPAPDASYDAVVSTLVLCTVSDPHKVLLELHRILRPGGKLVFIEHVAAHNNPKRLKWQQRIEPLWKKIYCGCCLTRATEEAISRAGFAFHEITRQSIRGVLPILRPSIKGIAVKG